MKPFTLSLIIFLIAVVFSKKDKATKVIAGFNDVTFAEYIYCKVNGVEYYTCNNSTYPNAMKIVKGGNYLNIETSNGSKSLKVSLCQFDSDNLRNYRLGCVPPASYTDKAEATGEFCITCNGSIDYYQNDAVRLTGTENGYAERAFSFTLISNDHNKLAAIQDGIIKFKLNKVIT